MTKLSLRIDWSEMDLFGHVNNVAFFKYQQAARVHYWEQHGITQLHKEKNIGPTLASVKCDFKKELHYPGNVHIHTHVEWIKNSSFMLKHQLFDDHKMLVAEGEDVVVMYDYNAGKSCPIPEGIRINLTC